MFILPDALTHLKTLPLWVVYGFDTKKPKSPYNPLTATGAQANNPATWATYDEAIAFAERHGLFENRIGGVGIEFANGLAGIDMDGVVLPDGTLTDWAREVVELMDSYTELSPSGRGLHILFTVSEPLDALREFLGNKDGRKDSKLGLELYIARHYFTVTGNVYGEMKPLAERTKEFKAVYTKYLAKPVIELEKPKPTSSIDTAPVSKGAMTPQGTYVRPADLPDNELWEYIFNNPVNGSDIRALYNGDISGYTSTHKDGKTYPDNSAADLALCTYLNYYTGGDSARVDRMYRQSGLMRDKWERTDYREATLTKARDSTSHDTISMRAETKPKMKAERTATMSTVKETQDTPSTSLQVWTPPMTGYDYVDSGALQADLARFQKYPEIFSGFENFDEAQGGLTPGMYVLGATPGLGKTTLLVQMSDNIAKAGNFVLYFSLEQSRLELTTKSLSRLTAQRDTKNAVSAINIRRGHYVSSTQEELIKQAIADYQHFSRNVAIVELGLDTTIAEIADTIKRFMDNLGFQPVVMVDYLQIVKPPKTEKLTSKEAVDYVVGAFKKLQVANNLVLFVISSFNRQNYLTPVDFESFKETGGIEYTCDVLLGLQPQVLTDELFNSDKKIKEKREAIDKAISAIPRKVMLKNLKNRFGRKGYSCGFVYDPRFDLFMPDASFKVSSNEQTAVL